MRVSTRLNLAVLPAIVGVAVLAALTYWGDRGRQAPETVLALAAAATVGSAVLSWRSTRFVSRRVGELAAQFGAIGLNVSLRDASDEFEQLSRVRDSVRSLANDQARLRDLASAAVRQADVDRRRHDALLEQVGSAVAAHLEEARLALHILQTSPFGELNENQEELIGAARAAADAADRDVRRFVRLVTMPAKRRVSTRESVPVRALLDPAVAMVASAAEDAGVTMMREDPETAPPVLVDRLAAQEALALLLSTLIDDVPPASELRIGATEQDDAVQIEVQPGLSAAKVVSLPVLLATALLESHRGEIDATPARCRIRFPMTPSAVWQTAAHSVQRVSSTT